MERDICGRMENYDWEFGDKVFIFKPTDEDLRIMYNEGFIDRGLSRDEQKLWRKYRNAWNKEGKCTCNKYVKCEKCLRHIPLLGWRVIYTGTTGKGWCSIIRHHTYRKHDYLLFWHDVYS